MGQQRHSGKSGSITVWFFSAETAKQGTCFKGKAFSHSEKDTLYSG